jgi:hypothetical protein
MLDQKKYLLARPKFDWWPGQKLSKTVHWGSVAGKLYYKFQFICNTPSFLEWTKGFRRIQNGPKGFQKLFSIPFLVAFGELLLCFCSKRSSSVF